MKQTFTLFCAVLFCAALSFSAQAQSSQSSSSSSSSSQSLPPKAFARHSFTGDFLGNKGFMGVSYEYRLGKSINGFGLRTGLGLLPNFNNSGTAVEETYAITVPLEANYLFFPGNHHLEIGLGLLTGYFNKKTEKTHWYPIHNGEVYYPTTYMETTKGAFLSLNPTLAYRYQRPKGGFTMRAGFSPSFQFPGAGGHYMSTFPLYPFVSFGISF